MNLDDIKYDERGLVPAVVQDARTREVLSLAYVNRESLQRTIATGETWFWSRSRAQLWHKGETSGNTQQVVSLTLDCDKDALRIMALPSGPACHKGEVSCFHEILHQTAVAVEEAGSRLGATLENLYATIESRKQARPEDSYTAYLFAQGLDKILKKIGEETSETIIAAKNAERESVVAETADLLYHLLVLLVERGITLDELGRELVSRKRSNDK